MSFIKKGTSALGKLFVLVALVATFAAGFVGVVYKSLQESEIKVPEIVGRDFAESEKEFAELGLKIKRKAERYSNEKPNTVLEQLPKAGDTVKTGQMILVTTSIANPDGAEAPATIKKSTEADDTEKIEELISDKPKKSNKANANTNSNKKKTSTTRDVIGGAAANSNSNSKNANDADAKEDKNAAANSNKSTTSEPKKTGVEPAKTPAKPPLGTEIKPKKTP